MENKEVKHMPPQKTWFFEDSDGRTFATNEKEAFNLLTSTSKWRRQDIQFIGMSDGTTYYNYLKNNSEEVEELKSEIEELKTTLARYVEGHDKLIFEQFKEEDDPAVLRAKAKIKEIEDKLNPKEKKLKDISKNNVSGAFEAELEKARGNIVLPRDFSVISRTDGKSGSDEFMKKFAESKRVI